MDYSMKGKPAPELSDRLRGKQVPHIGHLDQEDLREILSLGAWMRDNREDGAFDDVLKRRVLVILMVYESTRTRLGFEAAMAQLGGSSVYLSAKDSQMGRGESMKDTAGALGVCCDAFTGRLWSQDDMEAACEHMSVPVINACTPLDHTTTALGELMTIEQVKGPLKGMKLVYHGMARGLLHSLARVCPLLGVNLTLAIPPSYVPTVNPDILAEAKRLAKEHGTQLEICADLKEAVAGADFIQAATLIRSMLAGEKTPEEKEVDLKKWTMTNEVLACAKPDVLYSHTGPAHRGVCATDEVLDGPKSKSIVEAENLMFAKKAMLALMVKRRPASGQR